MKAKIYGLLGDLGRFGSSIAFEQYLRWLERTFGYELWIDPDSGRNLNNIVYDIVAQPKDRSLALVGYSLGGNGCAWAQQALRVYCVAHKLPVRKIDLIVGFDPTKNSRLDLYPVESLVQRCVLFQQCAWWFPSSLVWGRGVYVRAADGPQIETLKIYESHLTVQADFKLQKLCTEALGKLK